MSEELPYINGICVLTYNIENINNINLPEYYSVINPPLVEKSEANPFTAYGWLLGGTDIVGTISTISGLPSTYSPPEPWLYGNNGTLVSGECACNFETPFSSVSGTVQGIVQGNLKTKLVSGVLAGFLSTINNDIAITRNSFRKFR